MTSTRTIPYPAIAVIAFVFVSKVSAGLINFGREGDACNRNDGNWYAVPGTNQHFIYCHPKHGIYVRDQCALIGAVRKVFDAELQQCVLPPGETPLMAPPHPLSSLSRCSRSNQCVDEKWFCASSGRCQCRRSYVQIGTQCWPRVQLESGECLFDRQCSAVWVTAKCISRQCRCPSPQVPVRTSSGVVCATPDECPVGGTASRLLRGASCHAKGGCGDTQSLNHFFDCVTFGSASLCCPNRAYTCMQPVMPGNGAGRLLRYYYNPASDQCTSFMYRGGNLVNANAFATKAECDLFCRTGCPRGNAQTSEGIIVECENDANCGPLYGCVKRETGDTGVCCPLPNWICSPDGGRDYGKEENEVIRDDEYDAGTTPRHVTSVFYPVIRYYYSLIEHRCKAFLYQGEGGNFNQFLSVEQCHQFCSPVTCNGARARTKDDKVMTCNVDSDCGGGFSCTFGICCPLQERVCGRASTPYWTEIAGGSRIPLRCVHNGDCPHPFVCHMNNSLEQDVDVVRLPGYCCRPEEVLNKITVNLNVKRPLIKDQRMTTTKPEINEKTTTIPAPFPTLIVRKGSTKQPSTTSTSTTPSTTTTTTATTTTTPSTTTSATTTTSTAQTTTTAEHIVFCSGGRIALLDPRGVPVVCSLGSDLGLDTGECGASFKHQCSYATINNTEGICCTALKHDEYRCPAEMVPMIGQTNRTKMCSPLHLDSCPAPDAVCVFDELYGSYHCCHIPSTSSAVISIITSPPTTRKATTTTRMTTAMPSTLPSVIEPVAETETREGCPLEQSPFLEPLANASLECNPSRANTCPPGFLCHYSYAMQRYQCCGISKPCGQNSGAYVSPITSRPVPCDRASGCPNAYFCYREDAFSDLGTCCSEDPITSLCDQGVALRDSEGHGLRCVNEPCPRGYQCLTRFNISVCCPTAENVCTQPVHRGLPCEEAPPQALFHFDGRTKKCRQFAYSGCSGNDNRFDDEVECNRYCSRAAICPLGFPLVQLDGSLSDCSERKPCLAGYECLHTAEGRFCCPKNEMTCSLPRDDGADCAARIGGGERHRDVERQAPALFWYFNPQETACAPFEFRGCGGNFNRFETQDACYHACTRKKKDEPALIASCSGVDVSVLCEVGVPKADLDGHLFRCSNTSRCSSGYNCVPSEIGPPDLGICCPRPEMLCVLPEESGERCGATHFRYRYDMAREKCVRYAHNGCDKTLNSFLLEDECERFCRKDSAECTNGETVFMNSDAQRALSCSPLYKSCPNDFRCQHAPRAPVHFCCSIPADEVLCSSGKQPLTGRNNTTTRCRPGHFGFFDGCPPDYSCQETTRGYHLCCPRPAAEEACPEHSRPYIHGLTNRPMSCSPDFASVCPFGFRCRHHEAFGEAFCCSELGIELMRQQYPNLFELSRAKASGGIGDGGLVGLFDVEHCDDGSQPYSDPSGVRICHPHLSFSCPDDFACQYSAIANRNHCCRRMEAGGGGVETPAMSESFAIELFNSDARPACPNGLQVHAHPRSGQPIVCQAGVINFCPKGSQCEYSALYWQFICCDSIDRNAEFHHEAPRRPPPPVYFPGQTGCIVDSQCTATYPFAKCRDWVCICPDNMMIYEKTCVAACPAGYDDRDGRCAKRYTPMPKQRRPH